MTASAEVKAVASALAKLEGREVFSSDYPLAVRLLNLLWDQHYSLDHSPPMAPAIWALTDSFIAREQARGSAPSSLSQGVEL